MKQAVDCGRRRAFCKACIGCLGAGSVAAVGYPVASFLAFPQRLSMEKPLELTIEQLPMGHAHYARIRGRTIAVLINEQGPLVLSAACTHLGCSVVWDAAGAVFRCPCHGAVFDSTGDVVSGPVNVPLKRIPFEIRDGKIIVS
jgi:cytochrome b6-f complex iron-sulfur subunit